MLSGLGLAGVGLAAGGLAFGDMVLSGPARADEVDPDEQPLLVVFEFIGGWDTLLSLDPRNQNTFNGSGIELGYTQLGARGKALLGDTDDASGVKTPSGSNIDFGLAMKPMWDLFADVCIVRGINMATLSHGTGGQYFNTGKFPRGLAPSGSSVGTWWASKTPSAFPIPNLAVGASSYNEDLDPRATALYVDGYAVLKDLFTRLEPGEQPSGQLSQALQAFRAQTHCFDLQHDIHGQVRQHHGAFDVADALVSPKVASQFAFTAGKPADGSPLSALYAHYGLGDNPSDLEGPLGRSAIAAQAITSGLCQTATVRLTSSLDTHFETWRTQQPEVQHDCWMAVQKFIRYAKTTLDGKGKPYWDRMTVMCVSEFSRTPRFNAKFGRDHWLYSAALVAGKGLAKNRIVGASKDADYSGEPIDPKTGTPSKGGTILRPPDVWATVLKAAGLNYENVSNQSPVIIEAMLGS